MTEDSAHSRKSTLCSGHKDSTPHGLLPPPTTPVPLQARPAHPHIEATAGSVPPRPRTPVTAASAPCQAPAEKQPSLGAGAQAQALPHMTFSGPPSLHRPVTQTRGDKQVSREARSRPFPSNQIQTQK